MNDDHDEYSSEALHDEILALLKAGVPATTMARLLHLSPGTVREWARAAGIPLQRGRPTLLSSADELPALEERMGDLVEKRGKSLLRQGLPASRIAMLFGVSASTVYGWARAAGILLSRGRPPRRHTGEEQRTLRRMARRRLRKRGLSLLRRGTPAASVAQKLGVSRPTVVSWARAADIEPVRMPRQPPEYRPPKGERRIRGEELILLGWRDSEVADEVGVSRGLVYEWRKALGVASVPLSHPRRDEALALLARGVPTREVAEKFGVDKSTVGSWRREAGIPPVPQRLSDLMGRRFGRLMALRIDPERTGQGRRTYWLCWCECGRTTSVVRNALLSGQTKSCGCARTKQGRGAPPAGSGDHQGL